MDTEGSRRAVKSSRSLEFERKRVDLNERLFPICVWCVTRASASRLVRLTDVQNQSFRNVSHWFIRARRCGEEGRELYRS